MWLEWAHNRTVPPLIACDFCENVEVQEKARFGWTYFCWSGVDNRVGNEEHGQLERGSDEREDHNSCSISIRIRDECIER